MPCDSSYMQPTPLEIEHSRVLCLISEVRDRAVFKRDHWAGYHPDVYNRARPGNLAAATAELCGLIQDWEKSGKKLGDLSLELQMWWRDHQIRDGRRRERKLELERKAVLREIALAKLTAEEREALGL